MSVQEYLSTFEPQAIVRWMGMRRALIALVVAAAVAIAGVAAYVYMYEGSLDVAVQDDSGAWAHVWVTFTQVWVHDAAHRRRRPGAFDRHERNGLDLHSGDRPDHGRVKRDRLDVGPLSLFQVPRVDRLGVVLVEVQTPTDGNPRSVRIRLSKPSFPPNPLRA